MDSLKKYEIIDSSKQPNFDVDSQILPNGLKH